MQPLRLFDPSHDADVGSKTPSEAGAPPVRPDGLTGGSVIRRFLDDLDYRLKVGKISPEHVTNYRGSLCACASGRKVGFIEIVGERPIGELINLDITDWLRRNPQWKRPDTRQNNIAAVIACFNWAESEGILARSPYTKTRQHQEQRVQRRDATDEEADKVWAAASESLRRIIWFVDAAGVRTKEARKLEWSQVDWAKQIILIVIHKTSRTQIQPEPRIVGMDADGWAELQRWYESRDRAKPNVFLTPTGRPWTKNNLCQTFARLSERCGLAEDLTPYCFRHRYGTAAILAGMTEREAGDGLGHKDTRSTRRYSHTANKIEHIKAIADKFGAARKSMAAKKKAAKNPPPTPLFDD